MKLMRELEHWRLSGLINTDDQSAYPDLRDRVSFLLMKRGHSLVWEYGPQRVGVGVIFQEGTDEEREIFNQIVDESVSSVLIDIEADRLNNKRWDELECENEETDNRKG